MRCITRHQLLAMFLRNLSPFLMSNGIRFSNILVFVYCNSLLQIPPEVQVRYCDGHCRLLLQPSLGGIRGMLGIIVLSEGPMTHIFPDTSMNPSCLPHTTGFQVLLNCGQSVLFSFILLPPDILVILMAEKFQFCFIAPANRIPKRLWLIHMTLSTFLVLLGQY